MSVKTRKNMDMIEVPLMAEILERFFDTFIVEDENAKVDSHQVYSLYKRMCEEWSCDVYPYLTFQYFLKKRYPIHQQKKPNHRRHSHSYIYGIKVSIVIEFDLSRPWSWIPKGYYVLRKTTKGVTISRNNSHPEVNKKRVPPFDIMLMKNGKWDLRYCNVIVNMLKIKDYLKNYTMTKAGVKEITDMVESLPVCIELLATDEVEPKPIADYRPYAKVQFLENRMIQVKFVGEGIDNRSKNVYRLDICHSTTASLLILLHVNPHVKVKLLPYNKRKGTGWKIVNLSESESLCTPVFESDVESLTETSAKQELKKIITSRSRIMKRKNNSSNKPKVLESKKVVKRKLDVKCNSDVERIKKPKCNSSSNESNKVASASGLWMSNVVNGQQKSTGGDLQVQLLSKGLVILQKTSKSEKQTGNENSEQTIVTDVEGSLDLQQDVESMAVDSESTEQLDNIAIKEEPDSEDEMDKDFSDTVVSSRPVADIKQEIEEESLPLLLTCTSENFTQSLHSQTENSATSFSSTLVEKFPIKSECSCPSLHIDEGSASPHNLSENKSTLSENQSKGTCSCESYIPASECQEGFCEISESQIGSQVVHQSISDIVLKSDNPTKLSTGNNHSMTESQTSTLDVNLSSEEGHTSSLDVNQFMSVGCPPLTKCCNVYSRKESSDGVKESLKKMITGRIRGKIPTCSNPSTPSNTTPSINSASGMPTLRNLLSSKNSVVNIGTFLPIDKPDTQTEKPVQLYKYTLLSVNNPSALIKHSDNSEKICSVPAKAVSKSDDVMIMKDIQTCTDMESEDSNNDTSFQKSTQKATDIRTIIEPEQTQQNKMMFKLNDRSKSSEILEIDVTNSKFKEHFLSKICNITKDTNITISNHGNTVPHVGDASVNGEVNQSQQTHGNLPNFVSEYITQSQAYLPQNKPVNIAILSVPLTLVHQNTDICSGSSCGQVSVQTIPSALCTPSEKRSDNLGVKIESSCESSDFSNKQGQTFGLPINQDSQTFLEERSRIDGVFDKQKEISHSVDSSNSNTQEKCENTVTLSTVLSRTRVQSSNDLDQSIKGSQSYIFPSSDSLLKSSPFDSTNSSDYDYTSSEEDEKRDSRNITNSLDCDGKKDSSFVMVAVEHDVFETNKGKRKPVENLQDYRLKTSDIKLESGEINLDISNPELGPRPDTQVVKVLNSTNKVLNVLIDGSSRSIAPLSLQSYMNYSNSQISNLNQNEKIHSVIKTENNDLSQYGIKSNIASNEVPPNCALRANTILSGQIFHMVPKNFDTNTVISDQIGQSKNKADNLTPCLVSSDTIRSCGNHDNMSESENLNTPISSSFRTENVKLYNVSSSSLNSVGTMTNHSAPFGTIADFSGFYHAESDVLGLNSEMDYAEEIVKMSKSKDIKCFQNLNIKLQRQIPYDFLKVRIPREIYMDPCLNRPSFVVLERPQRIGNILIYKHKRDCNRLCRNQTIKKYKEIPIDIHLS